MQGIGTGENTATAPQVDPRLGRRLLGLSWAHLLNDGAANFLPGVLPAVLVSLHQPVRMAGVLIAALTIGQALQPLTGWVADRVGGRGLVVFGLLISSLAGGLVGVAHSTGLLIVLLLLIGIGNAFFHPQALAGVRSMLADRKGLLTSVFLVGGELGRGIWPTVASLVVLKAGLVNLWIVAVPGLLTVALLWRVAPRLPAKPRQRSRIRWREHAGPMTVLIGYRSVRAFTIYALVTFIPILWRFRGGTLVAGASIITTMIVVGVIGNLAGGYLSDRWGRLPVLVASALATSALVFPTVLSSGAWVWISAAVLGIALFLTASTTVLIGQDIFPENRSMGSGIALGLANGIGALLVLLVGFWVNTSTVFVVFWALAALGLLSAAVVFLLPAGVLHRTEAPRQ
ncbi:MAG: MFS transporter [Sciscionella sp.]